MPPQIRNLGEDLREGDVILSNHPCAGGSHLPDLTVITPVSAGGGAGTPRLGRRTTPPPHPTPPRHSG